MAFDSSAVIKDYGDVEGEVRTCRTDCALFDFSFMERGRLQGPGALAAIARLTDRPLRKLEPGKICYALRDKPNGILVADLTIWRHDDATYEVMSGRSEDTIDLIEAAPPTCDAQNLSPQTSIFAVQGPGSLKALAGLMDVTTLTRLPYFGSMRTRIGDVDCTVGRLGYTGEPGFEIVLPRGAATAIWDLLARRACPAGFAAADVLRIEAGFVLFANEFRVPATAAEAGLKRFAGAHEASLDPEIILVCFTASTRERPMLWQPLEPVARPTKSMITVTSACHSPHAGGTLGLGFALRTDLIARTPLHDPHGMFTAIELVSRPFVDPHKRWPRANW
jgi:glycine cleavage system T protein (aminomethyltransferase)